MSKQTLYPEINGRFSIALGELTLQIGGEGEMEQAKIDVMRALAKEIAENVSTKGDYEVKRVTLKVVECYGLNQ